MGVRDTAEQLEVCKADAVRLERELEASRESDRLARSRVEALEAELGRIEREVPAREGEFRQRVAELELAFDLQGRALAEAEHENARLASALSNRLRHDAHGLAQLEADRDDARQRLARIFRLVDPRRADPTPLPAGVIRRIIAEVTADPSIPSTPDWATLDACRRLVASIRDIGDLQDLERRLDEATRTAAEGAA
jgi:hypothetical protein